MSSLKRVEAITMSLMLLDISASEYLTEINLGTEPIATSHRKMGLQYSPNICEIKQREFHLSFKTSFISNLTFKR